MKLLTKPMSVHFRKTGFIAHAKPTVIKEVVS